MLLDEPSAALGIHQTEIVLSLVEQLKDHNVRGRVHPPHPAPRATGRRPHRGHRRGRKSLDRAEVERHGGTTRRPHGGHASTGRSVAPSALIVGFLGLGQEWEQRWLNQSVPCRLRRTPLQPHTRSRAPDVHREIGALVADHPGGCSRDGRRSDHHARRRRRHRGGLLQAPGASSRAVPTRQGMIAVEMSTIGPEWRSAGWQVSWNRAGAPAWSMRRCREASRPREGREADGDGRRDGRRSRARSSDARRNRVRPRVFHVGRAARGRRSELAVNAVIYGLCEALAEGLVLAERAGIERTTAYEMFAVQCGCGHRRPYRRQEFERPGEPPVAFRLALAKKASISSSS